MEYHVLLLLLLISISSVESFRNIKISNSLLISSTNSLISSTNSLISLTNSLISSTKLKFSIVDNINSIENGYLKDMLTVFGTTTLSDTIAQIAERTNTNIKIPIDKQRLIRFAIFGFCDGAVGHTWFETLDKVMILTFYYYSLYY